MQLRCVRSYYNKCLPFLRGEKFITKHSHFCSNGEKTAFVLKQTFSVTVRVLEDGQKVKKNETFLGHFQTLLEFCMHWLLQGNS